MIIYLHGFNSSGNNFKVELLKKHTDIDVYAPSYPSNDPDKAVRIISKVIEENKDNYDTLMIMGTSLGGFYTQYFSRKYGAMAVLINPLLELDSLKKHYGYNTNYNTKEKYLFTEANLNDFKKYNITNPHNDSGTLLLLDAGDKVIDSDIAIKRYAGHANVKLFMNGSHRFDHLEEAMPEIKTYYNSIWE